MRSQCSDGQGQAQWQADHGKPAFVLLKKWDDASGGALCGFDQ
jgi:hypothetical protein